MPRRLPQYRCRTSESRVSLAKEAFIEYLDGTGELRVYLSKDAALKKKMIVYFGILVQSDLNKTDKSVVYLTEEAAT